MKKYPLVRVNFLFFLLVGTELLWLVYEILGRRMVLGHDAFHHFTIQYYFLNSMAAHGEIPLWSPFLTHGSTTLWWYTIQGTVGLLANSLMLLGEKLKEANFLTIFYLGIFVDRLLLLVGSWLLSRRYFKSPVTSFFVCSSILASTIVGTQLKFTLYLFYAIPLILYFGHRFLETGRWRWVFSAMWLFVLQTIGNDAYFIPVSSLVVALYFLSCLLDQPERYSEILRRLQFRAEFWICLILTAVLLSFSFILFRAGVDSSWTAHAGIGRNPDGSVPLDVFLSYAGNTDLFKWEELLLRTSPAMDYTLYIGFLSLPLIILGLLFHPGREKYPVLLVVLIMLLFSMASFVSIFFYYTWPLMKFYRHLALVSPIIKLFLCFLAGFGFEVMFFQTSVLSERRHLLYRSALGGLLLFTVSMLLAQMACEPFYAYSVAGNLVKLGLPVLYNIFEEDHLIPHLADSAVWAFLLSLIFFVLPLIDLKKYASSFLFITLLIHMLDLFGYHLSQHQLRSFPLSAQEHQLMKFQPMPYLATRNEASWGNNPRNFIFLTPISLFQVYAPVTNFLFTDPLDTQYRTDLWPKPLDTLLKTYNDANQTQNPPSRLLKFPKNPALLKISGFSEDKIQFFSNGYFVPNPETMGKNLTHPNYPGDLLFYQSVRPQYQNQTAPTRVPLPSSSVYQAGQGGLGGEKVRPLGGCSHLTIKDAESPGKRRKAQVHQSGIETGRISGLLDKDQLSRTERVDVPYRVTRFTPNQITIEADTGNHPEVWMLYADTWHPNWKATINNEPTEIFIGDLAYKAILLKAGKNIVHLYHESRHLSLLMKFFMINSIIGLGLLIYMVGRCCFKIENQI